MVKVYIVVYSTSFERKNIGIFNNYKESQVLLEKITSSWPKEKQEYLNCFIYKDIKIEIQTVDLYEKAQDCPYYNIRQIF